MISKRIDFKTSWNCSLAFLREQLSYIIHSRARLYNLRGTKALWKTLGIILEQYDSGTPPRRGNVIKFASASGKISQNVLLNASHEYLCMASGWWRAAIISISLGISSRIEDSLLYWTLPLRLLRGIKSCVPPLSVYSLPCLSIHSRSVPSLPESCLLAANYHRVNTFSKQLPLAFLRLVTDGLADVHFFVCCTSHIIL